MAKSFWDNPRAWRNSWRGTDFNSVRALLLARSCDSGDIRARKSENFLAVDLSLLPKFIQVFFINSICQWHIRLIPAIISCLVTTNQEDCAAAWIKSVERTIRPAFMLCPELTQMAVPRSFDSTAVRKTEMWTPNSSSSCTEAAIDSYCASDNWSHHSPN